MSGQAPPQADEPKVKWTPDHKTTIVVAMIGLVTAVITSVITAFVTLAVANRDDEPSQAAVPAQTSAQSSEQGTDDSSPSQPTSAPTSSPPSAKPPGRVKPTYLVDLPWEDYLDEGDKYSVKEGRPEIGGRVYSKSLVVGDIKSCTGFFHLVVPHVEKNIGFHLTGKLGIAQGSATDPDFEVVIEATSDKLPGSGDPNWSEVGRFPVLRSSPSDIDVTLDEGTTGVRFSASEQPQACGLSWLIGSPQFS